MTRVADREANRLSQQRRRARLRALHATGEIIIPATKACSTCHEEKGADAFAKSVNTHDGLFSVCRSCDKTEQSVRVQRARENDPEGYRARRATIQRKSRHGLNDDDYRLLAEAQEFSCAICGKAEDELCVDHDHETGVVRGLLCRTCNSGIGMLNDDPALLAQALAYLLTGRDDLSLGLP